MTKHILFALGLGFATTACSQKTPVNTMKQESKVEKIEYKQDNFNLSDFLVENPFLELKVNEIYAGLDDTARVAQVIMPAIGKYGDEETTITNLVSSRKVGGLLLLNGSKDQCKTWVEKFNSINKEKNSLPFLYSADAEPTLFNRKIPGTEVVKKASEINSIEEVHKTAEIISKELKEIGINYNFSPVVDMSRNSTVGYRGFGKDPANIIPWSAAFIETSQKMDIIATAKHFPGHGLVSGDTHKALQVIDGDLQEVPTYPTLIKDGVLSIMVGHLAVMNNPIYNTDGLPSTISDKIVTNLLKDSLKFKGLIVTDAMNMGGVTNFKSAELRSIEAGCDITLMPQNTARTFSEIYTKFQADEVFNKRVEESSKKVIRMKICLGLI
jgi:beta-N-acetylhexosaminidase|tara:strand:- start:7019 stop:8167 length:1149 start_codon:yes stop_codon:yes gene_type:complete